MNRKLFNLAALVVMLITLMGLAGCDGQPAPSNQEIASPTGCFKSQGRYYDPKLKVCVQVTDKHQALVLNAYRYVNQLAEKGAGVNEYTIYPKNYLTADEAEVLWADLKDHGATMIVLAGMMPDDQLYDPEETWDLKWQQEHSSEPRIWGGPGSTLSCGWWQREDAPADTVQNMLDEGLKRLEKERPRPQLRTAIMTDGDCRFDEIDVKADAKVMRDWVNRHLDEIEGAQPIVSVLDGNMPQLGPTHSTVEGG